MLRREFTIELNNLSFHAHIGVSEQERIVGNDFRVTAKIVLAANGFVKESLDTSISYSDIYEVIKHEMGIERALLETVAVSITERLIARWPEIREARIKLVKVAPPITGIEGECGVEYFCENF